MRQPSREVAGHKIIEVQPANQILRLYSKIDKVYGMPINSPYDDSRVDSNVLVRTMGNPID